MNNPPQTRAQLTMALALRAHELHEVMATEEEICGDALKCIESWLQTPWEELCRIYHCQTSRKKLLDDWQATMHDQITNKVYAIARRPHSEQSYVGALDAMIAILEARLRPWQELHQTFIPQTRVREVEPIAEGVRAAGFEVNKAFERGGI